MAKSDLGAVVKRKKVDGLDVLTLAFNSIAGRGWDVRDVYVRKGPRVVRMQAWTVPKLGPVSTRALIAKGKLSLSASWPTVSASAPK